MGEPLAPSPVPRVSSDPSLTLSISQKSSRRSLILAFDEIEAEPRSPCRSARAQRSTSFVGEHPPLQGVCFSRSMTALPYLRFPFHPHNVAQPPVPPIPASPTLSASRSAEAANSRVVRNGRLRPSPRGTTLAVSPRPRSCSHTSDSSGSPSPNPSRPVSPSPLAMSLQALQVSSPRPPEAPFLRTTSASALMPIIHDTTMDGMSDGGSPRMDDTPASYGEGSLSAEGSQSAPLVRCASAEPAVALDPPLTLSASAVEVRRKRELQSHLNMRLCQSTSNLPDTRYDDVQAEHVTPILPRVKSSTQPDLSLVSPTTVMDLMNGTYSERYETCYIIDCRYPYEYRGGHLRGAINLSNKELVQDVFMTAEKKNAIVIFYCEFSSQRGPSSWRHLRECDRKTNKTQWPAVWYPQTFVLEGGYKAFWEAYPALCEPRNYIPMLDERYKEDLRQCQMQSTRMRSKSFSGGDLRHSSPNVDLSCIQQHL